MEITVSLKFESTRFLSVVLLFVLLLYLRS